MRRVLPSAVCLVVAGLLAGCGSGGDLNQLVAAGFGQVPFGTQNQQRDVDVKARGPLVLPPEYNKLPQPQNDDDQTASLGANWPTDPEAVQKQRAKERAERLAALEAKNRQSKEGRARTLSPEEMATWGKGLAVNSDGKPVKRLPEGQILSPQELKSYGGSDEESDQAGIPPEQLPLPPLPQ